MTKVSAGDALALGELYDRHVRVVFGLARRIVGRPEDAEEVVQDVFAQAWREAGRYEQSRATVAGWLVMMARGRAIDRLRARRSRPDQQAPVSHESVPATPVSDPNPETLSIASDEATRVRGALAALPENHRSLVELAYYDGLTHAEIAAETGTPLGTVKTRIRSAMTELRDALRARRHEDSRPRP